MISKSFYNYSSCYLFVNSYSEIPYAAFCLSYSSNSSYYRLLYFFLKFKSSDS